MADLLSPAGQSLTASLPGATGIQVARPGGQRWFTPGAWLPKYPTPTVIEAAGSGTTVVTILVRISAPASGLGTAVVDAVGGTSISATGAGTATVAGIEQYLTSIAASGAGMTEVPANLQAGVEAAGSGATVVAPVAGVVAAATGSGATDLVPAAAVDIQASGAGETVVGGLRTNISAAGSGTAVVTATVQMPTEITASGSGTASVAPATAITIAASGSGTSTVAVAQQVGIAATGSGTAAVTSRAAVTIAASGSGTSVVAAAVPAVAVVGVASASGTATSLAPAKPSGTAQGHVMIAYQCSDWGAYTALTAPSGWTLLTGLDRGQDNLHLKIWTKVAGSSEPSSYSFAQGSGVDGCVTIVTVRNANASTGSWLFATPAFAAASASRIAPSVTGAGAGAILLCSSLIEPQNTACSYTPPSGMTERADVQSTTWVTQSVASLDGPANPTGTKTFTASGTLSTVGGIEWSVVIPAA